MIAKYTLLFLLCVSFSGLSQVSRAPLQSFNNAGGVTGTITGGIPTHFSSVGQPMVLSRPSATNAGGGMMAAADLMFPAGSTVDSTPPQFGSNNTPASVLSGNDLSITADFTDAESGVSEGIVQYRSIVAAPEASFVDSPLTKGAASTWTGSIPKAAIGELGVEYKFKIKNGVGLENTSTLSMASINHENGLPITINTRFEKDQSNYRIIAIPLEPAKSVNSIFGDEFGEYADQVWRMYRYENGALIQLNGSSTLQAGKGYWFLSSKSPTGSITTSSGTTVTANSSQPFEIPVAPGWNQIGNPYNFDISWDDVLAANPTLATKLGSKARSFNGSVIELDEIKKFEGAYISFTGTTSDKIKVPVTKNTSINGRQKEEPTKKPLSENEWTVHLTVSNGTQAYDLGGVGMHPLASEGIDPFDNFNSPRFFEYLELKHPRQFFDMSYTLDVVPTQGNYTWNFNTETNQKGPHIALEWDHSYFGNTDEQLWLLDAETGAVWDMRKENKAMVDYAPIRHWRVAFGTDSYVKNVTLPEKNNLLTASPNPFTNSISIEVAIAAPSQVKVEVLDVNGRPVKTLLSESLDRGRYTTQWSLSDSGTEEIASGFYIVRFQAGSVVQYKRLIKN